MHKRILSLIGCILCVWIQTASSQEICPLNGQPFKPKTVSDFTQFAKIPILEDGRIKPVETYARNLLLRFSGRRSLKDIDAVTWLAKLLFAPYTSTTDKIFLINHLSIPETLGISLNKKRRYSFDDLSPALNKLNELATAIIHIEPSNRDIVEIEILRLADNLKLFNELSYTFQFAFPHPDFTIQSPENIKNLGLNPGTRQFSYYDLASRSEKMLENAAHLENKNTTNWTLAEQELTIIIKNMFNWNMLQTNMPFHIIPSYQLTSNDWLSPWDATLTAFSNDDGRKEMKLLSDLMVAYWNGDQNLFNQASIDFKHQIRNRLHQKDEQPVMNINLEILYNHLNPFLWSRFAYLFIFILFLIFFSLKHPIFRLFTFTLLIASFLLHFLGILMRMLIIHRPPVTNLYETFIFVALISCLAGIVIEKIHRQWLGIAISSIGGFIFLTIADRFSIDGDTLKVLEAVLNTNFWLSTHVVSITIGYSGICVSGIIAHIYLLQAIFQSKIPELLERTQKVMLGALGFGLTMTFIGTNLGGIWADQSWGRFWGWDPKENGALMIVLWSIILFHARIGKMIGPIGFAIGNVLGIIVVMWAWFGVNLLSIGLHSYGFTSGLARNLIIYLILQILFLIVTVPLAKKRTGLK